MLSSSCKGEIETISFIWFLSYSICYLQVLTGFVIYVLIASKLLFVQSGGFILLMLSSLLSPVFWQFINNLCSYSFDKDALFTCSTFLAETIFFTISYIRRWACGKDKESEWYVICLITFTKWFRLYFETDIELED